MALQVFSLRLIVLSYSGVFFVQYHKFSYEIRFVNS